MFEAQVHAALAENRRRAEGPTPSRRINILLSIVDDHVAGRIEAVDVRRRIEAYVRGGCASLAEVEGLQALHRFLDTRDVDDLRRGFTLLAGSASPL